MLRAAEKLTARLVSDFYDEATQRVYQSPKHHEPLLLRIAEAHDGPLPNATAIAADVLARLSDHCGRPEWRERAMELVNAHGKVAERLPRGHSDLLRVARSLNEPRTMIVMVPGSDLEANAALRAGCFACHWPGQLLALLPEQPQSADLALPLFQGRTAIEPRPRVFVCRDTYCEAPVHSTDALRSLLQRPAVT